MTKHDSNLPVRSTLFDAPLRALLGLASGSGANRRLPILIFHRVLLAPDPLFPSEMHLARFDQLCSALARWFNVMALDAAVERLRMTALPARSLVITFDDGYADNHDVALPVLLRHKLCATFFIATAFLGGGSMFNDTIIEAIRRTRLDAIDTDRLGLQVGGSLPIGNLQQRRSAIDRLLSTIKYLDIDHRADVVQSLLQQTGEQPPSDLMMTRSQVRALADGGMQIGAHTRNHPILAMLPDTRARDEIEGSKVDLETITAQKVTLFAYPNGKPGDDYSMRTVEIVRAAGFSAAVSTAWGAAHAASDLFQLPRFTPWDPSPMRFALRTAYSARMARPKLIEGETAASLTGA